jgi:hypothetical protein
MSSPVYWESVFQGNSPRILKALYGSFLIRDWSNALTSLAEFSPFADDGNLDGTLIGLTSGQQGWFDPGYLDENGAQFTPKYTTVDTMVWQSRMAQRTDVTLDQEEVKIVAVESNPMIDYLHWQLPLVNLAGEQNFPEIGQEGYKVLKPLVPQQQYRQICAIGVDGSTGDNEYFATVFARALMVKPEGYDYQAKKEVQTPMTFDSYPDPSSGFAVARFREGPAWRASGGSTASFVSAPVALAVTGAKAHLTIADPTSPNGPFTYAVTMQTAGTGAFTAVPGSDVTVVSDLGGETVLQIATVLTSGTAYAFKVVATGVNGSANAPSTASNSITAIT